MKTVLIPLLDSLIDVLRSRATLQLEILALRQQLAMLTERDRKRLGFRQNERIFWVWLYRMWPACLQTLMIVKPDTLVRWHRKGFRLYWTWKSRRRPGGRPAIDAGVRELTRLRRFDPVTCYFRRLRCAKPLFVLAPDIRNRL